MLAILSVLVGAITTGVVGNYLVQRWQLRTWRIQQRQLGYQAELQDLKTLLDDITVRSTERLRSMRRLVASMAPGAFVTLDDALASYQEQVASWNVGLSSLFVRIRLATNYAESIRFENEVHNSFYEAGVSIEQAVRYRRTGAANKWADLVEPSEKLDRTQGVLFAFLRDMTDVAERRREEIYFGRRLRVTAASLGEYSAFELLKLTFTTDMNEFHVVRSA